MSDQPKPMVCEILERYAEAHRDKLYREDDDGKLLGNIPDGCSCPVPGSTSNMSSAEVPGEESSETSNAPFPFLRLPYDIREIVYRSLLVFARIVIMDQSRDACVNCGRIQDQQKFDMLALFTASRQVGEEARRIFYSKNSFQFEVSMSSIAFIIGIGRENASLIRYVSVWLTKFTKNEITDNSTDDSTEDSTEDSTDGSIDDSTDASTDRNTDDSTDGSTDDSTDTSTDQSTDDSTDDSTLAGSYTATILLRPFTIPLGTKTTNIWNSTRLLYEFVVSTHDEYGCGALDFDFQNNYADPVMVFRRFADCPSLQKTMRHRNRLLISVRLDDSQDEAIWSNALARFDLFWWVVD